MSDDHLVPINFAADPVPVQIRVGGQVEYTFSATSFDGNQSSLTDWSYIELGSEADREVSWDPRLPATEEDVVLLGEAIARLARAGAG